MNDILSMVLWEWYERKIPSVIKREENLLEFESIPLNKVVSIIGFRRVGKTYLVFDFINELLKKKSRKEVVYINFEDERIPLETSVLSELVPAVKREFGVVPSYLFLDEIQVMPNWSKWVRRLNDSTNIKVFITSSSSKLSSEELPSELRGRCLQKKVWPLSFRDFLKFKGRSIKVEEVGKSGLKKAEMINLVSEYVRFGGMPEVVLADESMKRDILLDYYNTVVRRDIIERFNVKNEEALKALVKLLLNSTRYTINKAYNTLKSLGYKIGKTTVQEYISHVESSFFMKSIPIHSYKVKDEMQYSRKTCFVDNGFITLASKFSENIGRLYENAVAIELLRRGEKPCYWKNALQKEVDFVLFEHEKVKQLIQVCYDLSDYDTKERELKSLIKASEELNCNNLLVLTRNYENTEEVKGKKIKFIPLWKWLLKVNN